MTGRREEIDEERVRNALADLRALGEQAEGLGRSVSGNPDVEQPDRIERWGRLIGRSLGVVFMVYLIYYFAQKLL